MLLEIALMTIVSVTILRKICPIVIQVGLIGLTVLLLASPLLAVVTPASSATSSATTTLLLIVLTLSLLLGLRVALLLSTLLQC
jgi:hypothetical protein